MDAQAEWLIEHVAPVPSDTPSLLTTWRLRVGAVALAILVQLGGVFSWRFALHSSLHFPQPSQLSTISPFRTHLGQQFVRVAAGSIGRYDASSVSAELILPSAPGRACWRRRQTNDDFGRSERVAASNAITPSHIANRTLHRPWPPTAP